MTYRRFRPQSSRILRPTVSQLTKGWEGPNRGLRLSTPRCYQRFAAALVDASEALGCCRWRLLACEKKVGRA